MTTANLTSSTRTDTNLAVSAFDTNPLLSISPEFLSKTLGENVSYKYKDPSVS